MVGQFSKNNTIRRFFLGREFFANEMNGKKLGTFGCSIGSLFLEQKSQTIFSPHVKPPIFAKINQKGVL